MRTKIFGLVAIVCIAFAASFVANKVSKSSSALSMVAAANVEALAQNPADPYEYQFQEVDGGGITCHQTCYHKEAKCWAMRWTNYNWDAYCVFTGYQRDICIAKKC